MNFSEAWTINFWLIIYLYFILSLRYAQPCIQGFCDH